MKRIGLFTFILVLMLAIFSFVSFANEKEATETSSTEISEEIEATTPDTVEESSVPTDDTDTLVADATVSNNETNSSETDGNKIQEQDALKVKKLNAVKAFIRSKNGKLSNAVVTKVAEAALYANEKNQLDLSLILAVMWKESTFDPTVYTPNCYGVMQLHKNTAAGFGYKISDIKDPYRAADLGARIIKGHIRNYNGTIMGLTAYNQGTGNVSRGNYNTKYAHNVLKKQAAIQKYLEQALAA